MWKIDWLLTQSPCSCSIAIGIVSSINHHPRKKVLRLMFFSRSAVKKKKLQIKPLGFFWACSKKNDRKKRETQEIDIDGHVEWSLFSISSLYLLFFGQFFIGALNDSVIKVPTNCWCTILISNTKYLCSEMCPGPVK